MSLADVRELRIHVGAHKTATTHLQRTLQLHREPLHARGIDFIHPVDLRRAYRAQAHWLWLPGGRTRRYAAALGPLRRGAPVLAVSEENLLGSLHALFAADPYPIAGERTGAIARVAPDAAVHLSLGIRAFDRLWASAHVEALRRGAPEAGRIDRLRALARTQPPSWLGVAGRLQRACPGASLTVWRYEDYAARAVAAAFLGHDPGSLPDVPPPRRSVSPSAEGVRRAEALEAPADTRAVADIFAAHPADAGQPYRPFDAAETAAMQDVYARDMAAFLADSAVRVLQPGGG